MTLVYDIRFLFHELESETYEIKGNTVKIKTSRKLLGAKTPLPQYIINVQHVQVILNGNEDLFS